MAICEIIGSDFGARVTYTVTQDVANNRSTVRVTRVELKTLGVGAGYPVYVKGGIFVNGVQTTVLALTDTAICGISALSTSYAGGGEGSWSGFSTKDTTITHSDDGTATIPIKANLTVYTSTSSGMVTVGSAISKSVNVSMPTIPRVSELSASPVELGQAMSIGIVRAASGFTDTVTWSCGSVSGTIVSRTSETWISWTPSVTLANQVPNGTAASILLRVDTFQGETQIGSRELTVSCGVPAYLVPSLTVSVEDKLGYAAVCGGYVQNQSQARVRTQAYGTYGSTIQSIAVTCGRLTGTGADLCFALENSGTITVSVTVTDSRGRTAVRNTSITVLAYKKPSVTVTAGYRCDRSGNQKPDGEWLRLVFNAQVTALTGNTAAYTGSCTVHGTTQTRQASLTAYAGQFALTGGSFLISAGIDTAYDCKISVSDKFCTVESGQVLISVAFALLDMCRDTKAIGIGARAAKANKLCIGLDTDMGEHRMENLADPVQNQDAATKAYVERLLSRIYPVGSIYISVSNISPASLFGGTWEQLTNRFLVGAGDQYSVGQMGGADTVALQVENLPEHRHSISFNVFYRQTVASGGGVRNVVKEGTGVTESGSTGSGAAHENRPPYLAVYMWKRVA